MECKVTEERRDYLMSFLDYKNAPDIPIEELKRKAWQDGYYKKGFRDGMEIVLDIMQSLLQNKEQPKKINDFEEIKKILIEKRFFLMDQIQDGTFDYPGIVRLNHTSKKYEWFQPLSGNEVGQILLTALQVNSHAKDNNRS